MKKYFKLILTMMMLSFSIVILSACNNSANGSSSSAASSTSFSSTNTNTEEGEYQIKNVNFYKEKNKVDRQVELRYYSDQPNVPYIGIKKFFKEFYKTDINVVQDGYNFKFSKTNAFIELNTMDEIFTICGIDELSKHPDFKESNSTIFLKHYESKKTTQIPTTVALKSYSINTYKSDGDAYVPITLISNIVTGCNLFIIVYNEKDLYEFDYQGQLSDNLPRTDAYYGEEYSAPMIDETKPRQEDMIAFSYNLICLMIDNFRGYTTQMEFVDNNIVSLGLNGTLEKYYPIIKELLLSTDRITYLAGTLGLFYGLSDGGHTGLLANAVKTIFASDNGGRQALDYYANSAEATQMIGSAVVKQILGQYSRVNLLQYKTEVFNFTDDDHVKINETDNSNLFYYRYDSEKKLAFIGFDKFAVDYDGWNDYYKALEKGETPTNPKAGDTYFFVRNSLFRALDDGAERVVLDLTTNGGGDSAALLGIVGLFNEAMADFASNDVVSHSRSDEICKVDVNLDGKYDETDVTEANKLKSMNIVLMTSKIAFSCGNLLPSLLKELGIKTIGEQTGGGSCAIMLGAMPDGAFYVRSSYKCLSNQTGHNIDGGVPVDVSLVGEPKVYQGYKVTNYSNFFNLENINNVIKELYPEPII